MTKPITIAVVTGSLRRDSLNAKFGHALTALAPAGVTLKPVRIGDLPLFNQDDESNPSEAVKRFKDEITSADAVIFVTPEYNRSIPGVLKNAIDHGSRPYGKSIWAGKPAAVAGVSPGAIGTALAQQHLRNVLSYLDMPMPGQPEMFLQAKEGFFSPDGSIGEASHSFVKGFLEKFVQFTSSHTKV